MVEVEAVEIGGRVRGITGWSRDRDPQRGNKTESVETSPELD